MTQLYRSEPGEGRVVPTGVGNLRPRTPFFPLKAFAGKNPL